MRRFLAAILALAMMVSLSVAAFAVSGDGGSEAPLLVEGRAPGETIDVALISANDIGYSIMGYQADDYIDSVWFESGKIEAVPKLDSMRGSVIPRIAITRMDLDLSWIKDKYPLSKLEIGGNLWLDEADAIKDTMYVKLENGEVYSYPIRIRHINAAVRFSLTAEGLEQSNDGWLLPIGETATFHLDLIDKMGIATPPYQLKITYSNPEFQMGEVEMSEDGERATFTVTNLGAVTGENYANSLYLKIEWEDADASNKNAFNPSKPFAGTSAIDSFGLNTIYSPHRQQDHVLAVGETITMSALLDEAFGDDVEYEWTLVGGLEFLDDGETSREIQAVAPGNPGVHITARGTTADGVAFEEKATCSFFVADLDEVIGKKTNSGMTSSGDDAEPSPTENAANNDKTQDALAGGETVELKLYNGSAAIDTFTMDALGESNGQLVVRNGKMTVSIPGGFGRVNEPGRIYYPLDCDDDVSDAKDIAGAAKGENIETQVIKAGGDMVMPTTVTLTLRTRLTGAIQVYHYDKETGKYTLLASTAEKDGEITFTTWQLGCMVLTTGRIHS